MSEFAPMAPMPPAGVCRWCGGRLRALMPGDEPTYCQSGCTQNHVAPFLGDCLECGRAFKTGRRQAQAFCWECDTADRAAYQAPDGKRIYHFSRFGRGRYIE